VNPLQYTQPSRVIRFRHNKTESNPPPMAYKRLITIFFVGFLHVAFGQPNCIIKTRYLNDGLTVKYIQPVTIDSNSEETCGMGIEMASVSNYITLQFTSSVAPKQLQGDLIIIFSDKSEMRLPQALINLSRVNGKQVTLYTFYILDKFTNQIISKPVETITYQLLSGEQKSVSIKSDFSFLLKNGLLCLNPLL
jgi:hypothetical protein